MQEMDADKTRGDNFNNCASHLLSIQLENIERDDKKEETVTDSVTADRHNKQKIFLKKSLENFNSKKKRFITTLLLCVVSFSGLIGMLKSIYSSTEMYYFPDTAAVNFSVINDTNKIFS